MALRYYQPKWCADCKTAFLPSAGNQTRCRKCQKAHQQKKARMYYTRDREAIMARINEERKKPAPKRKKSEMTWPQIIKVCEENNISYGQAVAKGLVK